MAMLNIGEEEEVGFQCEVPENPDFTATEIEELLSLVVVNAGPPSPGSDSQGSNRTTATCSTNDDNDRKLRRMISNRESARRSRCRKKRYLEDVSNEVNQLMISNRDLKDRLGRVLNRGHLVLRENDWLWMESVGLQARLTDLCRILAAMQSPLEKFT